MAVISDKHLLLDRAQRDLGRAALASLAKPKQSLAALAASLDAMSPLKVLGRGYAIAQREDGMAVDSTADVASGDKLKLTLSDGSVDCRVL